MLKKYPWFVSDTTERDIQCLIEDLSNGGLSKLTTRWLNYLHTQEWKIIIDYFWNSPIPFPDMNRAHPQLYQQLAKGDLVIFKGDLNYRKLLIDDCSVISFDEGLQGFYPCPILAIRTLKSDPICGLTESQMKKLDGEVPDWRTCGRFGIIQFFNLKG